MSGAGGDVDPFEKPNAARATGVVEMPVVSARGLTKVYKMGDQSVRALDGVDIDLASGAITMVVGPSGCGKTTLISVLAATLDADSGSILAFGERLDQLDAEAKTAFRRANIGFIFQQYNLLPGLTAVENVEIPLLLAGRPRGEARRGAAEMLARVDLGDKVKARPSALSGGQQQRVAIARALVHHPRLLVCDEPTAALDGDSGRRVMNLIRDVAVEPGRSVVVVTHDTRLYRYADVFAVMSDGRIARLARKGEAGAPDSEPHV